MEALGWDTDYAEYVLRCLLDSGLVVLRDEANDHGTKQLQMGLRIGHDAERAA